MKLPVPSERYDPEQEKQRDNEIMRADRENHKKDRHIEVGKDVGIIFTDPDGVRWLMTVDNTGAAIFTSL